MSVGFGFSVGDFIAALQLVATVADALRESGLASTEYRGLVRQLDLLEHALRSVNRIELDDEQHAEGVALREAAAQCQHTINEFWKKNVSQYRPSLQAGGSGSRIKDGWMKIKWALCQKEDLAKLKADLIGHTESINLIMTTIQMASTRIDSNRNKHRQRTLAGKMQEYFMDCMQRMNVAIELVSTGIQQGKQLLAMTAKVIGSQTNVQIFQAVLDMQQIITRIPGQVNRQQPVYFIDALGRHTLFHLEFVMSAEALTYVLQSNFKNIGSGAEKIGKGEFAIQDSCAKRDVDLSAPWEACFRPGQHVDMSMVFKSKPVSGCPNCHNTHDNIEIDKDIECACGVIYRSSVSWVAPIPMPTPKRTAQLEPVLESVPPPSPKPPISLKRKIPNDELQDVSLFRRVRLKTSLFLPSQAFRPNSPVADPEEDEIVVKCTCGINNEQRNTIYCQMCDTWQHIECYYPEMKEALNEDFDHICRDCQLWTQHERRMSKGMPPYCCIYCPDRPIYSSGDSFWSHVLTNHTHLLPQDPGELEAWFISYVVVSSNSAKRMIKTYPNPPRHQLESTQDKERQQKSNDFANMNAAKPTILLPDDLVVLNLQFKKLEEIKLFKEIYLASNEKWNKALLEVGRDASVPRIALLHSLDRKSSSPVGDLLDPLASSNVTCGDSAISGNLKELVFMETEPGPGQTSNSKGQRIGLEHNSRGRCDSCNNKLEASSWTRGLDLLCNACGLHYAELELDPFDHLTKKFDMASSPDPAVKIPDNEQTSLKHQKGTTSTSPNRKRRRDDPSPDLPIIIEDPNDIVAVKRARNILAARKSRERKQAQKVLKPT